MVEGNRCWRLGHEPDTGIARRRSPLTSSAELDVCAGCHALRSVIANPGEAGETFLDTHASAPLEPRCLVPTCDGISVIDPKLRESICVSGISRLPDVEGDKPARKAFKTYPIGYFHIDIAEVQTKEGKLFLFVAIDRTSKFAFAQLTDKANRVTASAFLTALVEAVLTNPHGSHGQRHSRYADGPTARYATHMFDMRCLENGIEHRLTKPNHPWTNGQVERMTRTLKEATVRRYHYDSHEQLRSHLDAFLAAYNFAKRLKTLRGLTPHEYIRKCWIENPDQFTLNPFHHKLGLNMDLMA